MMTTPSNTSASHAPASPRAAEKECGANASSTKKKERDANHCKGEFAALLIASQVFQKPTQTAQATKTAQAGACSPAENVPGVSADDSTTASTRTTSEESATASIVADKGLVLAEPSNVSGSTAQPTATPITPAKVSTTTLTAQAPARGRIELSSLAFARQPDTSDSTPPMPKPETLKVESRTDSAANVEAQGASATEGQRFGDGMQADDFIEVKAIQPGDTGALVKESSRRGSAFLASALAEVARRARMQFAPPKFTPDERGERGPQGDPAPGLSTPESNLISPQVNTQLAGVADTNSISAMRTGFDAWAEARAATEQLLSPTLALARDTRTQEARSVRLRLHPEDLGEVEVRITRGAEGRVSAHIIAENEQARHALAEGLAQLRADLERAGLALESLDVRTQSGREQAGGSNAQGHDAPDAGASFKSANAQSTVGGARVAGDDKLLSVRA